MFLKWIDVMQAIKTVMCKMFLFFFCTLCCCIVMMIAYLFFEIVYVFVTNVPNVINSKSAIKTLIIKWKLGSVLVLDIVLLFCEHGPWGRAANVRLA